MDRSRWDHVSLHFVAPPSSLAGDIPTPLKRSFAPDPTPLRSLRSLRVSSLRSTPSAAIASLGRSSLARFLSVGSGCGKAPALTGWSLRPTPHAQARPPSLLGPRPRTSPAARVGPPAVAHCPPAGRRAGGPPAGCLRVPPSAKTPPLELGTRRQAVRGAWAAPGYAVARCPCTRFPMLARPPPASTVPLFRSTCARHGSAAPGPQADAPPSGSRAAHKRG